MHGCSTLPVGTRNAARGHQLAHGEYQPNIETGWETLRRVGISIIQLMRGHASIQQTQPLPERDRRGAATRIGDELEPQGPTASTNVGMSCAPNRLRAK
jgi:hypothetical protein